MARMPWLQLLMMAILQPAMTESGQFDAACPNGQICNASKHLLDQTPTNYVFIGNPGAGKSTVLNGLIGEAEFKAGVSLGGGLTFQLDVVKVHPHIFMDTPGLADIESRKQAAKAITQALKQGGRFKIVFVITLESGRIKPADMATIRLVLEAAPEIGKNYGILVNKLSSSVAQRLSNTDERTKLLKQAFVTLPNATNHFTWMMLDQKLLDAEDEVPELPSHLVSWMRELPSVVIHTEKVSDIKDDNFEALAEEMGKQLAELKNENAKLSRQMEQVLADAREEMREAQQIWSRQLEQARADAAAANKRASEPNGWQIAGQIIGAILPPVGAAISLAR